VTDDERLLEVNQREAAPASVIVAVDVGTGLRAGPGRSVVHDAPSVCCCKAIGPGQCITPELAGGSVGEFCAFPAPALRATCAVRAPSSLLTPQPLRAELVHRRHSNCRNSWASIKGKECHVREHRRIMNDNVRRAAEPVGVRNRSSEPIAALAAQAIRIARAATAVHMVQCLLSTSRTDSAGQHADCDERQPARERIS
jgi:hypothetical protein